MVLKTFVDRDTMACQLPTDGAKLMKLKCDLVSMLLVVTDGRFMIAVEKTRNKKKDQWRGASYGHSDA